MRSRDAGSGPQLVETVDANGRVTTRWVDPEGEAAATRAPPAYADEPGRKLRGPEAPPVIAGTTFEKRKMQRDATVDTSRELGEWMKRNKVV